jgi:hypothetical protein
MALLRAYLDGDAPTAQRLSGELAVDGTGDGFAELLYAALVIAARRQFAPSFSDADVIRFVASLRAELSGETDVLDPVAAEQELRAALGQDPAGSPDPVAKATAQVMLLEALVRRLQPGDAERASLLDQARELAVQIRAQTRGAG